MRDLLLSFPQWQGGGELVGLSAGARQILARLATGTREVREVPVRAFHPLIQEAGILARSELLEQALAARDILQRSSPDRVFTVGGDCGVELAPVSHLLRRYAESMAVVWLDAHGDANTPATSPSGLFHGMPLRALLGEGDPAFVALVNPFLKPQQVFLAGTRDLDPPEEVYLSLSKIHRSTVEDLSRDPSILGRYIRSKGFEHVYIHVDLDVCDPNELPSVACPTRGGIHLAKLVEALEVLSRELNVVGASLVELCPREDVELPAALLPILAWFDRVSLPEPTSPGGL